jgi:hypothetical protein
MEIINALLGYWAQAVAFCTANPDALKVIGAVIAAAFLFRLIKRMIPVRKDDARRFSKSDNREGFMRAGNRCEMEGFLWFRCSGKAEHGDHHYPHSRGGSSTLDNFVAACGKCNMSKGAKIPTRFATWRLVQRRRGYFPKGTPLKPGARVRRPKTRSA